MAAIVEHGNACIGVNLDIAVDKLAQSYAPLVDGAVHLQVEETDFVVIVGGELAPVVALPFALVDVEWFWHSPL